MATPEVRIEYDAHGFVKDRFCSSCGSHVKYSHKDDVGTRFYRCEKCGQISAKLRTVERRQFEDKVLDVETEVNRILNSRNISLEINIHLANIISGEENNRLPLFVLLLSGKFREAEMKQMILLKGTEGSGKSTLMSIADCFKVKDVGRFSEHALDYTNLRDFEILRLKEIGHMDEEKQGTSAVKFLSSDDKGYIVEVTVKDKESNKFITEERRIPPITVLSSTTRVVLDPQYVRRNWIFNPDESEDQTIRVCLWKAKLEREKSEVALGLRTLTSRDFSEEVLKSLVNHLEPCAVVIPFPESLIEVLNTKNLRVRGDYSKVLVFIKLYAFLNQNRLPKVEKEKGKIVFVTPDLCIEALRTIQKPLISMSSNLEARTRKLIEVFKELKLNNEGTSVGMNERQKIAIKVGKSEKTIRTYLNELEVAGYVSSDEKKPKTFALLYDVEDIEKKSSGISAKLESDDSLIIKMNEEAQKWFKSLLEIGNLWVGVDKESFLSPYKQDTHMPKFPISDPQLSIIQSPLSEITSENRQNAKLPISNLELEERLRQSWSKGTQDAFITLIAKTKPCSLEEAKRLYAKWLDEGLVVFDPDGFLILL